MIALLALQLSAQQPLPKDVWASVSVSAHLAHTSTVVDFMRDGAGQAVDRSVVRMTSHRLDQEPVVTWASSETCSAVRTAIERLESVPQPQPVKPGDTEFLVLDGTGYSVRFYARYGSELGRLAEYRSNAGTPLSTWVSETLAPLKPCWSPTRPM